VVATPVTAEHAADLLGEAFYLEVGVHPGARLLALLLAMSDLETAGWARLRNWNFGNIIATDPEAQDWYAANDSGNARKFRAYDSAEDGARAFVNQLMRDSRAVWREGLLSGDPVTFARALKGPPAYYEAPLQAYTEGLQSRWEAHAARLGLAASVGASLPPDQLVPLYPAEVQTWVVPLPRAGGNGERAASSDPELQAELDAVWPDLQELLPGPTSAPTVTAWAVLEADGTASSVLEWTAWRPTSSDWVQVLVQFDYLGTDRQVRWDSLPLRPLQVWRLEEHIPDSRVHHWLRTLWEASKLAAKDAQEFAGDAGRKLAGGLGTGLGLALGAGLVLWLALSRKRGRK
jgi:hypothetical protein